MIPPARLPDPMDLDNEFEALFQQFIEAGGLERISCLDEAVEREYRSLRKPKPVVDHSPRRDS